MDEIKKYYRDSLKRYGAESHEAVGWDAKRFQDKRFEYLARISNLQGKRILDFGAGLGDFYGYLERHSACCIYTGMEMVPELVEAARKKYPDASFVLSESLSDWKEPVDFVFASGTFNVRNGIEPAPYFESVLLFLRQAFKNAREGVAVNFLNQDLSDWDFEFDAFLISPQQVKAINEKLKPRTFKNIIDPDLEGEYTLHFLK